MPWTYVPHCIVSEPHDCAGKATEMVGPYSCCEAGAIAERDAQDRAEARRAAFMNSPEARRELLREQAWERRHS